MSWEENVLISPEFTIHKQCKDFIDIADTDTYDLIYFDAFGARVQPELWTETIFQKMFKALRDMEYWLPMRPKVVSDEQCKLLVLPWNACQALRVKEKC